MRKIGFTTRVIENPTYYERRDAFDQRWMAFFEAVGLIAVPIPNQLSNPESWIKHFDLNGIVLTGGNDLSAYGGDAPERDWLENRLIDIAIERKLPLIGVCRGMQLLHTRFGGSLKKEEGHVTPNMPIRFNNTDQTVNSYHDWALAGQAVDFRVIGKSSDNVIKAIVHVTLPILGIMWHPERFAEFRQEDIQLFRKYFYT